MGPLSRLVWTEYRSKGWFCGLYNSTQASLMGVYVPDSEQFQVECGSVSTSLISNVPCSVRGVIRLPATGGGVNGAQPCLVAANRERGVMLTKRSMREMLTRNRTRSPSLLLRSAKWIAMNDQTEPLAYLRFAICSTPQYIQMD